MKMPYTAVLVLGLIGAMVSGAQEGPDRDQLIRERYEQVLERDPLQQAAFDRVYESYMLNDGVDAWLTRLAPPEGQEESVARMILRGRILARQFRTDEAITALGGARDRGETSPALQALLGRLYYESGRDEEAIAALNLALEGSESPEDRSAICRLLGSVYLRSGKRAEAAAAWQRIAELTPGDLFALRELAEIYEENRMWDEAIAARRAIIDASPDDPYRQCQSWRAIGQAELARERHAEAIAAFETGLTLAAPGNWLHEDLKNRLVGVYEARGDLEGLTAYLEARLAESPGDMSMRELLADVWRRRGDTAQAEALLNEVIARAPDRLSAREMLIAIQREAGRVDDAAASVEALIAQFPHEPAYLQRLGDLWLEHKDVDKAKAAWGRVVGDGARAENHALLGAWLERAEFNEEAIAAYEAALAIRPDREWRLRVAGLRYDLGEEEAALAAWQAAVAAEETPAAEIAEVAALLAGRDFPAEAEALYRRAIEKAPDQLDHVLALARLLQNKGDHTAALALYNQLSEQSDNEYFKSAGERGMLEAHAALGTLEAQRTEWEAAVQRNPSDIAAREKLARLYARGGNRPGVVKLYEESVTAAPDRLDLRRLLASAYRENRENDKAITAYEGLLETDPERAQVYLRELMQLHSAAGRGPESVRAAERLVELSPTSPEAIIALANAYLAQDEVEKGLQQYRNLIRLDTTQPAYYRDFGDALARAQRFGEAQEIYRKMLDAAPDDVTRLDAVNRLAQIHVRLGQGDTLIAEFQRRLAGLPKSLPAYQELAAVYRNAGQPQRALEILEQARGQVEDTELALRLIMAEASQLGDFQRVVAIHEELLSRSAQPGPQDLDRLASAYAQAGRLDDAVETWKRMAEENRDDAQVQSTAARQLDAYGYQEEARMYVERVLALDPYDHALRLEFAQQLLMAGEPDRAVEQFRQVLDIGDRPAPPTPAGTTGAPTAPQPGQPFGGPAYFPPQGAHPGWGGGNLGFRRSSMFRGQFGGNYEQLRQQAIQMLVQIARQDESMESPVETWRKRMEAEPDNVDLRRDFILICEVSQETEMALESALALRAIQPGDTQLVWRIVQYYQQLNRTEEAIAELRQLVEQGDAQYQEQARTVLVRVLAQSGQLEEAEAELAKMNVEGPARGRLLFQIAGSLRNTGLADKAGEIYRLAGELAPDLLHESLAGRARLLQESGELEAARDLYLEAAFSPEPTSVQQARAAAHRQGQIPMNLYMPQEAGRGRQSVNNMIMLPGFNYARIDHQRAESLNQAVRLSIELAAPARPTDPADPAVPDSGAPAEDATAKESAAVETILARLRAAAEQQVAADGDARDGAGQALYYYAALVRNLGREQESLEFVQAQLAHRPNDFDLINLALYLLDGLNRRGEMEPLYERVAENQPALADNVARARLQLALLEKDVDKSLALFRAVPDSKSQPGRPAGFPANYRLGQLGAVVRLLRETDRIDAANALMEEELARSREPQILTMLAETHLNSGEHDKAIALAREAFERQGAGRTRHRGINYSMRAGSLQEMGLHGLHLLWRAHRDAGRGQELIDEFKGKVAAQPGSVALRTSLVGLYLENGQMPQALEEMTALVALRPNDVALKVRLAGLTESNNDPKGALAILESIVASRPSVAAGLRREIARLYKDLGRTEDLAEFRERVIQSTRNVDELQEIAHELARDGDHGQAADLLARARRAEPGNTWLTMQEADFRWQADQRDAALELYLTILKSGPGRGTIHIDPAHGKQVVERFAEVGRLEDLRAALNPATQDIYTIRTMTIMKALVARQEKNLDEAERLLDSVQGGRDDQEVNGLRADMAEERGDYAAAIGHLERAFRSQGHGDFQRIARLCLQAGESDRALGYLKQFAALQGGSYGHRQSIQLLDREGRSDLAERYFREVYGTIPESDEGRYELAEALLQIARRSDRFDAVLMELVFVPGTRRVEDLARRYLEARYEAPGLALGRIRKLLERFPDSAELKSEMTNLLGELGSKEDELNWLESLPRDGDFDVERAARELTLLRELGQWETWRDRALAVVENTKTIMQNNLVADGGGNHPGRYYELLQNAELALIETGRRNEIPAIRDQLLASAAPGLRTGVAVQFARLDAERGDYGGAVALLRSRAAAREDGDAEGSLLWHLFNYGYSTEGVSRLKQLSGAEQRLLVQGSRNIAPYLNTLLRHGETDLAWRLFREALWGAPEDAEQGRRRQSEIRRRARMLEYFLGSGVTAADFEALMAQVPAGEDGSHEDRLLGLGSALSLARWPEAIERAKGIGTPAAHDLTYYVASGLPASLRAEIAGPFAEPYPDAESEYPGGFRPPVDPFSQTIERVNSLLNEKQIDAALKVLDALVISADKTGHYMQRAASYAEARAFERALADYDAILQQEPESWDAAAQRAVMLVKLGRAPEAMDAWRALKEIPPYSAMALARALAEAKHWNEAGEVFDKIEPATMNQAEWLSFGSLILLAKGEWQAAFDRLEQNAGNLPERDRQSVEATLGRQLLEDDAWRSQIADGALVARPMVARTLLQAAQIAAPDSEARRAIVEAMSSEAMFASGEPGRWASLLSNLGHRDKAVALLAATPPAEVANKSMASSILTALSDQNAPDEMGRLLLPLSERWPELVYELLSFKANTLEEMADSALRGALLERGAALARNGSDARYIELLRLKFAGDAAAVQAHAAAMLEDPQADAGLLLRVAAAMEEDQGAALYEKVLKTETFRDEERTSAANILISRAVDSGRFEQALDYLVAAPGYLDLDTRQQWSSLFKGAQDAPFEVADAALLGRIQAHPESPWVSHLIALRARVADWKGQPLSEGGVAALPIPEAERREAQVLSNAIQSWIAAPPVQVDTWESFIAGPEAALLEAAKGGPVDGPDFTTWQALWTRQIAPGVVIEPSDWGEKFEPVYENPSGWFMTEIHSPDERTITLRGGSRGWMAIWLNGEIVYKSPYQRIYFQDGEVGQITLKAGANRMLVRVRGINYGGDSFALGIWEGREGLKISAPRLPHAEPASYPAP